MTRHPCTVLCTLAAASLAASCATPTDGRGSRSGEAKVGAAAPQERAGPISEGERACGVAAAAAGAEPLNKAGVDAFTAYMKRALNPPSDEEQRFEQLVMSWNVEHDMSAVEALTARLTESGARLDGVARGLDDVAELMLRLETRSWLTRGGVWLRRSHRAPSAPEGDGRTAFTIFVGGYPDASNPYAALDVGACGAPEAAAEIDLSGARDVTLRGAPEGAGAASAGDAAPTKISTRRKKLAAPSPRDPEDERTDAELLEEAVAVTREVDEAARLGARRANAYLYGCAAGVASGAQRLTASRRALRLESSGEVPECDGVTATRDGGFIVLSVEPAAAPEPAPAPTGEDRDALVSRLDHLENMRILSREFHPDAPEIPGLLQRVIQNAKVVEAEVVSVDATGWEERDGYTIIQFELGISGSPEAFLEALGLIARMTRIAAFHAASYDASREGAPAALTLEVYFRDAAR